MTDSDTRPPEHLRFSAWHSSVVSRNRHLVFLVVLGIVVTALLLSSACSLPLFPFAPTATPTCWIVTRTPDLIPSNAPPPTYRSVPTLRPPVKIEEPEDGACLDFGTEVDLGWNYVYDLRPGEHYRLGVQARGENYPRFYYTSEDHYSLTNLSLGEHDWIVDVVSSRGRGYEVVSKESDRYSFVISPPIPVVHNISPTSTVHSTSVTVIVNGENLTCALTITIGDIALQTTFVNSKTITATTPLTLEVGEYPVLIEDSAGGGVSSVSFTVEEPPPTPTPTVSPTTSRPPSYPAPKLVGVDILGCSVTFKWDWDRTLAEDEWFAVRVGESEEVPDSRAWTKEYTHPYDMGEEAGDYSWQIAICQGDPSEGHCPTPLAISERGLFSYQGCWKDD